MACQGVIVPVLPEFARSFGVRTAIIGIAVSAFGIGRLVVNVPLGMVADRYGRRVVLIGGPLVTSAAMLGCAFSPNIGVFLFWRVVTGVGSAMYMTGAQIYLADISTPDNRAKNIATNQGALFLGVSAVTFSIFLTRSSGQQLLMPLHGRDELGLSPGQLGIVFTLIAWVAL